MSCEQLGVLGGGLLNWDLGAFLCLPDDFCRGPPSLCVACQGPALSCSQPQEREAGSCHTSRSGWGGDSDSPPLSSPVCSSAQNTVLDGPASVRPLEACFSAAILLFSSPARQRGREQADVHHADGKQGYVEGSGLF